MDMKKHYSVLDNLCFVLKAFFHEDHTLIFKICIYLMTGVLSPLLVAILPSYLIWHLEEKTKFSLLAIICLGSFAFNGMIQYVYHYLKENIDDHIMLARYSAFESKLREKSQRIDFQKFESAQVQRMLQGATNAVYWSDMTGVFGMIKHFVLLVESILGMLVYIFVIRTLNIWIVGLLIGVSVIRFYMVKTAKSYERKNKEKKESLEITQNYLYRQSQSVQSGKDVRLYQMQHWLTNLYRSKNKAFKQITTKEKQRYLFSDITGIFLDALRDLICYGYIIYMLGQGMPVSSLVLYINMIRGFGTWMTQISDYFSLVINHSAWISDYRDYMDFDEETNKAFHQDVEEILSSPWKIELKDVSFTYDQESKNIIDHLNLVIHEKEKIAIVGLNGAGKTTLIKLICGLYHPDSGQILINGIDIESLSREQLFAHLSTVFQESNPLSLSIKENITLGHKVTNDTNHYCSVLKQSGLYDKIQSLEKGDQTYLLKNVSKEGIYLSGGEIQKLLCARAIYNPSGLLVLDEPTAALDALAEQEMYERYLEMTVNRTAIFISHRLASTRFCDRILFFENGQIKESGTHESLLKAKGKYAHLFEVQSQYYQEGSEIR